MNSIEYLLKNIIIRCIALVMFPIFVLFGPVTVTLFGKHTIKWWGN